MVVDADSDPSEVAELVTESYCSLAPRRLADRVDPSTNPGLSAVPVRSRAQSAKTSRECWMKNVWSCPLLASSALYLVFCAPSGTTSSE